MTTDGLQKEFLFQDELVLAGLDTGLWLMREEYSGIHYFNDLYLAENRLSPHKIYANNAEMLRKLVVEQVGQTILPKIAANAIPYETLPGKYTRNMYLVTQQQKNPSITDITSWLTAYFKQLH